MASLTPQTFTKTYLTIILLIATLTTPLPYSIISLILLTAQLYTTAKPPRPQLGLALTLTTLIFTPLALAPTVGNTLSALLAIPILYQLDQNLQQNAQNQPTGQTKKVRNATNTLKTLTTTLTLLLLASVILLNQTLMLTTLILITYIGIILAYILRKIPKTPLETSKALIRIIVGETEKTTITLNGKNKTPMHLALKTTQPWIRIDPLEFTLPVQEKTKINLTIKPPLAGPSKPQITTSATDPWGLIQTNQTIAPIELHIIPRAKYAQWLARKYLHQTTSGASIATELPSTRAITAAKQGVEFYGSRAYEPGDRLKDIDWKHVSKLQELIVREYIGAHGQTTIITANLDTQNPETADKLAYNLVVTALTLAIESLPTALAIYNQNQVITATPPTNPRETLKKTLELTQNITITKQPEKVLQPTQTKTIQRTINQLQQTKTQTAQNLTQLLQVELQATQNTAKTHPATQAIEKATQNTPAPATITLVSPISHDAEALNTTLEKLKEKGYNIILTEKPTP